MTYAPAGSAEFQTNFGEAMVELGQATQMSVGENLASLVLGGGFGRGEGGITFTSGSERAFNDVDLFLFVHSPEQVNKSKLHELEHRFSDVVGAEVEFSQPFAVSALGRIQPAQMWFDLLYGHQTIAGDKDAMRHFSPAIGRAVPCSEGTRLLLNRGAGLLWARLAEFGAIEIPDADFVRRNIWKSNLALRDAALIINSRYPKTWTERFGAYSEWYEIAKPQSNSLQLNAVMQAGDFKIRPDSFGAIENPDQAIAEWVDAFLELEGFRFGMRFTGPESYQAFDQAREPAAGPKDALRNVLKNAKQGRFSTHSARNSLYSSLPMILAGEKTEAWKSESLEWLNNWKAWC